MDLARIRIGSKLFWVQVHQSDLLHSLLIYHDLGLKVIGKQEEDFFLAERVREEENTVVNVVLDNLHKTRVGLFAGRKVILWVGKGVVKMQIVDVNCDTLHHRVALFDRAEPLILEHKLREAEVTSVKDSAHLTSEQEHDRTRAVASVNQDNLDAFFLFII